MLLRTVPVLVLIAILPLTHACGAEERECFGTYLGGRFTNAEVRALTEVLEAFEAVGLNEPCYIVSFIWDVQTPYRGVPWKDYRTPAGVEPTNPEEGYKGLCSREFGVVYIRRVGNAEPYLYWLLIHELLHAVGYDHGDRMRAKELEVREELH